MTSPRNLSLGVAATVFGVLITLLLQNIPNPKKINQILQFLQLLFCTINQLCSVLIIGHSSINCSLTAVIEFGCYFLFLTFMESVLFYRGLMFTKYKKTLLCVIFTLWASRIALGIYQLTTIYSVSIENEYCNFMADFSIAGHQLWLQIVTEVILLIPFLEKMSELMRLLKIDSQTAAVNTRKLMFVTVHNIGCTLLVIISQFVCSYVTGLPGIFPYLSMVFGVTNLSQSVAVLNAMEVMSTQLVAIFRNTGSVATSGKSNTSKVVKTEKVGQKYVSELN
ncbi:hypothetical protein BC833DRAFT_625332 [Globomyces pollinis-pini]|nr:hypothetical protein BC833DRAFT_625332 [Globomyces pollinis-pini]